jgi:YhcH/YjgK/YiaL family protein
MPPGRHDVDGSRLFAIVSDYATRPADDVPWEAHRRYIDVQYVHSGVERIGHAPLSRLAAGTYDGERDLLPAAGPGEFVTLEAGSFAILFPQDAHRPGIAVGAPQPVRKVVLKVAVDPESL